MPSKAVALKTIFDKRGDRVPTLLTYLHTIGWLESHRSHLVIRGEFWKDGKGRFRGLEAFLEPHQHNCCACSEVYTSEMERLAERASASGHFEELTLKWKRESYVIRIQQAEFGRQALSIFRNLNHNHQHQTDHHHLAFSTCRTRQLITMLKSTYKPSANAPPPLLPGWTEHKAPTGHTYYYHADTKTSTYTRPAAPVAVSTDPPQQHVVPNLSDPRVANAYMVQQSQPPPGQQQHHRGGFGGRGRGGRGGAHGDRSKPQPTDRPMSKVEIPGCEPWILVYTKCGRRFAHNPAKNASYWRIPEKLQEGILELDKRRIREKAGVEDETEDQEDKVEGPSARPESAAKAQSNGEAEGQHDYDSSEYEEVEVTDDEEDGNDDEHATKRQRTGESGGDEEAVEFDEADIAAQLQAMGEDYGLDPGEYDDGNMDEWPEGAAGIELSEEDTKALFKDLLNDYRINPYSPWEKLIEEGKVIDDSRYTILSTMRERKEVWEEWSREKIKELRAQRAKQEKKDPKIPYLALLQEKATSKLYWPEFKRKFKKEPAMKDMSLPDKDREKLYREHINRLKLPQATLKSELAALLKSAPISQLNNQTLPTHLPPNIVTDLRYISLDAKTRDSLVEAFIQTLPPPPEDREAAENDEAAQKALEMRRKREQALQDREQAVEEEKRRQEKRLQYGRAMLRDEERELQAAMQISKKGLQSHFTNPGQEAD